MAEAKALFKRHQQQFYELMMLRHADMRPSEEDFKAINAILYAAAMICEAIRNDMDETEIRTPKGE